MSEQREKSFLEVRDLVVEYTSDGEIVHAVNGISLSLNKGETLGLVGETGAGKTTIAKAIMKILPDPPAKIRSGEIWLDGENLLCKPEHEMLKIRGAKIANTHHRFDHTANNCYFDTVYMAKEGVALATIPFKSFEGIDFPRDYHVEVIQDGDVLHLGGRDLEVFAMPDHAISSLVFLDRKGRILFVGDELSDHGKDLSGTVQNFAGQLERLMEYRSQFDYLCGGSDAMISADYVERYLENCRYILADHEGKLFERRKPPEGKRPQPTEPEGVVIYDRKKPRPVDRGTIGGPEGERDRYLRVMEHAGVSITYDLRRVRWQKACKSGKIPA